MRAIILAAGRGSRMGGLTADQPKCMTPVRGKALLRWQLDALQNAGISDVALVRGYLADKFTLPLRYFDNTRWAETNMVVSLIQASEWLSQSDCVVSYSDILYESDSVHTLMQCDGDICVTYDPHWLKQWEQRFDDPLEDAETFRIDSTGKLLEIGKTPSSVDEVQGQYMGLLKFTPSGWLNIQKVLESISPVDVDKLDMTSLLQLLLEHEIEVLAVPVDGHWYEFDSQADLSVYSDNYK